jgi:hypothetical protein
MVMTPVLLAPFLPFWARTRLLLNSLRREIVTKIS